MTSMVTLKDTSSLQAGFPGNCGGEWWPPCMKNILGLTRLYSLASPPSLHLFACPMVQGGGGQGQRYTVTRIVPILLLLFLANTGWTLNNDQLIAKNVRVAFTGEGSREKIYVYWFENPDWIIVYNWGFGLKQLLFHSGNLKMLRYLRNGHQLQKQRIEFLYGGVDGWTIMVSSWFFFLYCIVLLLLVLNFQPLFFEMNQGTVYCTAVRGYRLLWSEFPSESETAVATVLIGG